MARLSGKEAQVLPCAEGGGPGNGGELRSKLIEVRVSHSPCWLLAYLTLGCIDPLLPASELRGLQ